MHKRELGQSVVYVDKYGKPRNAIVTRWWQTSPDVPDSEAGANLVFVSDDANRQDSYGRQIERETSVVHKSRQAAPGFYWCWPDEVSF